MRVGDIGADVRSVDGPVVCWSSLVDDCEVVFAPHSQREETAETKYHGFGREMCFLVRVESSTGLHDLC